MQGLGGRDEDPSGTFTRGGWAIPLVDDEAYGYLDEVYSGASALLFGRRTYTIFAESWGSGHESQSPIAIALNDRPKYLLSTTVTDPTWAVTTVLNGDALTEIRALKASGDGNLVVPGSRSVVQWLLANDLVDQLDLATYPIIVGQGMRLFPDAGPDAALELTSWRTTAGGITMQSYRPTGRPNYAE